jgi:hypothetical protein
MARKTRIEFPGAIYHVLDRGDRRERIYRDDDDRRSFLEPLAQACGRAGWRVHAYVLMNDLGGDAFRDRMLALLEAAGETVRGRIHRDAVVVHDHTEGEARRLLNGGLKALGLRAQDLELLACGVERKAALAALIRGRTTVSNAWTAEALRMGHPSRVTHCLKMPKNDALMKNLTKRLAKGPLPPRNEP